MSNFAVVILTAAPAGLPAGAAFLKVDNREAMLRSIELFINRDEVRQTQIIIPPGQQEEVKRRHGAHLSFTGVRLTANGERWNDQLHASLEKLDREVSHVILHDAARCLVPYADIDRLLESAGKAPVTALTTPADSTLFEIDESKSPLAEIDTTRLVRAMTPILFTRDKFIECATQKAMPHGSLYQLLNGSSLNTRVTPADLSLATAVCKILPKPRPKAASNPFEEAQW